MALIAFLLATPIDEIVLLSLFGKDIPMPIWLLILLAILFGWQVMPRILAYAGK